MSVAHGFEITDYMQTDRSVAAAATAAAAAAAADARLRCTLYTTILP